MTTDQEYFRTVYYSGLWYSQYFKANEDNVGANIIQDEVILHRFRLRMLSLFFESIYIPRTHLITSVFPDQYKIADRIIDSDEFGCMTDAGQILVSSYPGLDAVEDNLRILERKTEATEIIYPDDKKYLDKIPITKSFVVDTSREAKSNAVTFPQYGELLKTYSPELGRRYQEVVRRSNLKDIPFFHERFLMLIREELPRETFDSIWRNTNSIYLTSGAPEHDSFIAYFNEEIEHTSFRFQPYGIDRYLFSPSSLYTFLEIFFERLRIPRVIDEDMRITHQPLLDVTMRPIMERFRRDYQKIAWTISKITGVGGARHDLDQQALRGLFELVLDGEHGQLSQIVRELLADAEQAATAHGGSVAMGGVLLKTGGRYGSRFLRNRRRRRRFPGIYEVIDRLGGSPNEG